VIEEKNISTGINIDEDTKRYYPNNNLASQIIGFCGSDNHQSECARKEHFYVFCLSEITK